MPDASTEQMFDVANYVYWAKLNGLPLKFELTGDEMAWVSAANNTNVWSDNWAFVDQPYLVAYEFIQHLLEFSQVLKGDDWESKPFFIKYFTGTVFPKFAFFSAHQETLYPIFQIFDEHRIEDLEPASSMFLDFFEDSTGMYHVKVIYKKDAATEEAVLVNGSSVVTLEEFISFVEAKISLMNREHQQFDVESLCKSGYSVKDTDY